MNEILIKIYVPKIEEQYEVWIPANKKIHEIITLLVKAINEYTKGYYIPKKMPYLYDKTVAKVFNINLKVIETDIKNGSELILL